MLCPRRDENLLTLWSCRYSFLPHSGLCYSLSALDPLSQGHALCAPQCCGVDTPPKASLGLNEWYTLALLSIYTALETGDRGYCFMARKIRRKLTKVIKGTEKLLCMEKNR